MLIFSTGPADGLTGSRWRHARTFLPNPSFCGEIQIASRYLPEFLPDFVFARFEAPRTQARRADVVENLMQGRAVESAKKLAQAEQRARGERRGSHYHPPLI